MFPAHLLTCSTSHRESQRLRLRIVACGAFLCLLTGFLSSARADTVTWQGADDYWDVAANWSSYPNLPGTADDVQNNTTFTITHRQGNDVINSFLSEGAFILSGGTLSGSQNNALSTIQVNNTFTMSGGTLANATVNAGTGGQGITVTGNGSTLSHVTLNVDATLNANSNLGIQSGFHNASGININIGNSAYVSVNNDQTLDNLTVHFVGNGTLFANYGSTVTLGSGFVATGQDGNLSYGGIINNGLISASGSNGVWLIGSQGGFINNGTVQANDSETIHLIGYQSLGSAGKYDTQGSGAIFLGTTLDNKDKTFDVASQVTGTRNFIVYGGSILNGTLANAQSLKIYSATLDGVNLTSDLNLNTPGSSLSISNDFSNANGISINLGNATSLSSQGNRTLDNLNVNFTGASSDSTISGNGYNLILGSNFKATGKYAGIAGGTITNNGTLSAVGPGGHWYIQSTDAQNYFINNGTLQANDGENVYLYYAQSLGSTGRYDTQGSGAITLHSVGTLDNTGKTFDVASQVTGTRNFIVEGTILNGTINRADLLKFDGGALNGVTLGGGLNLNQAGVSNRATIVNAFVYPNGATFTLGNNAYLYVNDDRTFDNLNVNFTTDSAYGYLYANNTLTLGNNFKATGKYADFDGIAIVNNANLLADGSGVQWSINPTTFTNNGTVAAANGATVFVSTSAAPTSSGNINVGEGSNVYFSTDLNQTGGATTVDGDLYLGNNGGGSSLLNLSAGTLLGKGTIHGNLSNNSRVQPGTADARTPARLNLTGNYTQTSLGILDIRLGSATDFGQLAVKGNATLAGTLDVSLSNGYLPAVGTEFDILTASSVSGTFDTKGSFNTGLGYDVTYMPTFVRIRITNNAVPGPDSVLVLGAGLAGVAVRVRRRRK